MAETTVYIECEKFGEHEIEVGFDCHVENDGIGWYEYWGAREYDAGTDYVVFDEVYSATLVRSGFVKEKEDAPKIKNITFAEKRNWKTKEHDGWFWYHRRDIKASDVICEAVEKYVDDAPMDDVIDRYEPDYDDYDDRYDY